MSSNAANLHRISSRALLMPNDLAHDSAMSSIATAVLGIFATTIPLSLSVDHRFLAILNEYYF